MEAATISRGPLKPARITNPKKGAHQAELKNPKYEAFCHAYVKGMSITDAALKAGFAPTSGPAHCSRLLRKPEIQGRIACLREMHGLTDAPAKVDKQWILNTLVRNIEAGLNANDRAAVNRGLELLGREHGLFTERRIVAQDPLDGMTVEELRALLSVASRSNQLAAPIEDAKLIGESVLSYSVINDTHNNINDLRESVPTSLDPSPISSASVTVTSASLALTSASLALGPPAAPSGGAAAATAGGDLHTPPTGGASPPTDPTQKLEKED